MFPVNSRYHDIETVNLTTVSGRKIAYLRRRFVPQATTGVSAEHLVTQDERLDNITARYLGDPEQFWRVCDANTAMQPDDLTAEIGRRLQIPLLVGGG